MKLSFGMQCHRTFPGVLGGIACSHNSRNGLTTLHVKYNCLFAVERCLHTWLFDLTFRCFSLYLSIAVRLHNIKADFHSPISGARATFCD